MMALQNYLWFQLLTQRMFFELTLFNGLPSL
jgi:hypothetical protein